MIEKRTFGPVAHNIARPYTRADLEIYGINTFRPSYTVHVFFNDPSVKDLDKPEERATYAGRLSVFGHPRCVGDEGHCHVPDSIRRFDTRPSHPLTRAFRRVIVTEALRTAIEAGRELTITFLAGADADKNDIEGKYLFSFKGLQIVTFD